MHPLSSLICAVLISSVAALSSTSVPPSGSAARPLIADEWTKLIKNNRCMIEQWYDISDQCMDAYATWNLDAKDQIESKMSNLKFPSELVDACKDDKERYCKDLNVKDTFRCMIAFRDNLRPECVNAVTGFLKKTWADKTLLKTILANLPPPTQALKDACKADKARLCGDEDAADDDDDDKKGYQYSLYYKDKTHRDPHCKKFHGGRCVHYETHRHPHCRKFHGGRCIHWNRCRKYHPHFYGKCMHWERHV
jgi:hypothetical protein